MWLVSGRKVICHGIPDMRELQDGDIVNIDVSTFYNGYHGDLNEVRQPPALSVYILRGALCFMCSQKALELKRCPPLTSAACLGTLFGSRVLPHMT